MSSAVGSLQFFRIPQMAVNALRTGRLESIDGQICHTKVQYGDSIVYYSIVGRHLRYHGKLRGWCKWKRLKPVY